MHVTLIRAWSDRFEELAFDVRDGATVGEVLDGSPWRSEIGEVAVFGVRATRATVLQEGDRIECLRPLRVDPKQARRTRADARRSAARPVR